MKLDLGKPDSIRAFTDSYLATHDRLDLLINNAGLMAIPRWETEDGFEMQFGVNHLGHFALTGLLLPALLQTPGSRVVTVSSMAGFNGSIDFDDLMGEEAYSRYGAYSQSKLANVLFTFELQRRLEAAGADTISVGAPRLCGHRVTEQHGRQLRIRVRASALRRAKQSGGAELLRRGRCRSSMPLTHAGCARRRVLGPEFHAHAWIPEERTRSRTTPDDAELAAKLWAVSEELTGVRYEWTQAAQPEHAG